VTKLEFSKKKRKNIKEMKSREKKDENYKKKKWNRIEKD